LRRMLKPRPGISACEMHLSGDVQHRDVALNIEREIAIDPSIGA
jgi:hypothetical protein